MGLVYRIVGPSVIQITTPESAEDHLELEFYPVAARLSDTLSGPALAEQLKGHVATTTWSDVDGPGEICFDPASQCLIVLQSQPAQAAVERLLSSK